jgi:hypothetical protein
MAIISYGTSSASVWTAIWGRLVGFWPARESVPTTWMAQLGGRGETPNFHHRPKQHRQADPVADLNA